MGFFFPLRFSKKKFPFSLTVDETQHSNVDLLGEGNY